MPFSIKPPSITLNSAFKRHPVESSTANVASSNTPQNIQKNALQRVCHFLAKCIFQKHKQAVPVAPMTTRVADSQTVPAHQLTQTKPTPTKPTHQTKAAQTPTRAVTRAILTTEPSLNKTPQLKLQKTIEKAIIKNNLSYLFKVSNDQFDWAFTTSSGLNVLELAIASASDLNSLPMIEYLFSKTSNQVTVNPDKMKRYVLGQPKLPHLNPAKKTSLIRFTHSDSQQSRLKNCFVKQLTQQQLEAVFSNPKLMSQLVELEYAKNNPMAVNSFEVAIKQGKVFESAYFLNHIRPEDLNKNLPSSDLNPLELALAHATGPKYSKVLQTLFVVAEQSNTVLEYSPEKIQQYKKNPAYSKLLRNTKFAVKTIDPEQETLIMGKDNREYSASQAEALLCNPVLTQSIFPNFYKTQEKNTLQLADAILNKDLAQVQQISTTSINWDIKTPSGLTLVELAIATAHDETALPLIQHLFQHIKGEHTIDRFAILNFMHQQAGGGRLTGYESLNALEKIYTHVQLKPKQPIYEATPLTREHQLTWQQTLALSINPLLNTILWPNNQFAINPDEFTPVITQAIENADLGSLIQLSLNKADLNTRLTNGKKPLELALISNNQHAPDMIRWLVQQGAKTVDIDLSTIPADETINPDNLNLLIQLSVEEAIADNRVKYIKTLAKNGYDLTQKTDSDFTPNELAQVINPGSEVSHYLRKHIHKIIKQSPRLIEI